MKGRRKQKENQKQEVSVYDLIPRVRIVPIVLDVEEPPPRKALESRYSVCVAEDSFKERLEGSQDKDELKNILKTKKAVK